ncbi:YiiX/YebB-like N1pC/P60 family cysteine hydrolase [Chitinibacter tainanensis]|uniref:YiiX/YebB-like N1pC/P60 family cysteine hydrolase n=1 Tax=Chitinibacter tainanensis TaxID=230667 RepID=UPI0004130F0B|nr:YiiX/YebB-like N1pC/P60 family cysteine hydrolase [Chitinibacter tainanensis]
MRWMCILLGLLAHCAVASESSSQFQSQVAQLVSLRNQAYQFAVKNQITKAETPPLTRAQSNQLRAMALRYIELRAALLPYATQMAPLFQTNVNLQLSQHEATDAQLILDNPPQALSKGIRSAYINPGDARGQALLEDIQRGLAAALVLMDSYQIAIEPYRNNPAIAYLLTYDVGNNVTLRQLSNNYYSAEYRTRLKRATEFVDQLMQQRRERGLDSSPAENDYYALSQSTVWYVRLHRENSLALSSGSLKQLVSNLSQQEKSLENTVSFGLSMGFGNMLGLVKTRNGKLRDMPASEQTQLESQLQPMDILLEKTPFRLTDKMIPGHYGHVAIWLGSEAQLRELGVWERIPAAHQQKIRQGGRIVEALRSGVTISRLEHFLDIDDLLVLRQNLRSERDYLQAAALTTVAQVGKEYDFNFDVLTHERIVCSELAYVVFPDLPWPLDKTLGRYTISPDNVAQLAIGPQPLLDPVVLYRAGQRQQNDLRTKLAKLINPKATWMAQN